MTDVIVAFRNLVKAPKDDSYEVKKYGNIIYLMVAWGGVVVKALRY